MAATFVFKLGGLDLSSYLRVNPDDKMDPEGQPWVEPAFSETPFSDGQVLISTTVMNREQLWPLYLVDPTRLKDQLHALIRTINNAASVHPLVLEWRDSGASNSTFFDVSFVRFEPDFNFRRGVHGYAAGTLHVWTNGYGHTGTTRVTATAAGTGIFLSVPIGSVAGDAPALMVSQITDGGVVPSIGRIIAVAPITNPSYTPRILAAALTDAQPGATLIGASGADGSQYLALPVSPVAGASGVACKVPLPNPTIAGGDNRILAVVRSGISGGVAIYAVDPYGNAMGGTAVASMSQAWGLVDLGVCRLPTVGYPTQPKISIIAGGMNAQIPNIIATPGGLALNEVFCLPDKNLTLILERAQAAAGASVLSRDSFAGAYVPLNGRNDSLGNPWSEAWNNVNAASPGQLLELNGALGINAPSGAPSAMDSSHLAGLLTDTMVLNIKPYFAAPGSGAEVRLVKETASGVYVQARLSNKITTYALDLAAATNATLNTLGSLALATLSLGPLYRFSMQVQGPGAFVNLSRDDGSPVFIPGSAAYASVGIASNAALAGAGVPAVALAGYGGYGINSPVPAYAWEVDTIPLGSGMAPYDTYTIDGVTPDSFRTSSAGVFGGQKLVSQQRGAFPKMSPSTTSVAVIAAAFDQGTANDFISAVISVRERYTYGQ